MIRALLLDIDGVLANGEAFYKQLEHDYGISPLLLPLFFKKNF
ncbi:hypothetical protein [Dictyobacter kobayashii]|uniref:Uncharacterized protein n=1 Tax=Dictyobacter kobayashii TaxID=2014872 RepID=A0A402AIB7_9CHLR|nr:hypothetical protein [Dictyobacter kobayashii]GCE18871.1 hypothetical protein KDK_26710 [Dictyobacter kobayashii]